MIRTIHFVSLGALLSLATMTHAQSSNSASAPQAQGANTAPIFALDRNCGTPPLDPNRVMLPGIAPSDCAYGTTSPQAGYNPGTTQTIPVVVHVIQHSNGTGFISQSLVQSQIDILNEDFLAMSGSNGANGNDSKIQFVLASTDPNGQPTNGITYSTNSTWFNDGGSYWNTLRWDPHNYMNIYTNNAGGFLGYVPDIPQGGVVGTNGDRIVIAWDTFGLNAPIGFPYNKGRTATHEVGHYLGLWHTFDGGCGTGSCYTTGDRICDTNAESGSTFGCPGNKVSCGNADPIHNYMDYSDDLCMWEFTPEQINRMRCTLQHWRPNLANAGPPPPTNPVKLNIDLGANTTFSPPGAGYGGIAGQTGTWNGVSGTTPGTALLATNGSASGVSISVSGGNGNYEFNNAATTGDVQRVLDDLHDAGNSTWTLSGVPAGFYTVFMYSWAPDNPTGFLSQVRVVGGAAGFQTCGGANWGGSFVYGSQFVSDTITVSSGSLQIQVQQVGGNPSSLNAIQIVGQDVGGGNGAPFCLGDGSGGSCPCLNGGVGKGCATSATNGATLTAFGNAKFTADTFGLSISGIPGSNAGLCVKGSTPLNGGLGNPIGDGLFCTNSQIRSQVIVSSASGNVTLSNWQGVPFSSFTGAANSGAPTYYQWWFRDPSNTCSGSGFNFTGGWVVTWQL